MKNLLDDIKIVNVMAAATAATTTLNGSIVIDRQGFEGCLTIVSLGDVTDTSVLGLQMQENDSNSTTGMTDITGAAAAFTAGASNADEKILAVDVHKPRKRYLRPVVTRGTANAVIKGAIAILYNGRFPPKNLVGDVIAQTTIAPA
jgi:hypothetical protein